MNTLRGLLPGKLHNLLPQMESESARQGHYYLGVEHLFMAMTHLEDGATSAALKELGLSPRFIRHSVRTAVGAGDNRRRWPDFRSTPRLEAILDRAAALAETRDEPHASERDLLMAILQEGESIPARVLQGLGVDLERLQALAAGWQDTPLTVYPPIPIRGMAIPTEHARVLSQMFNSYARLEIIRPFEGFSGASVLLVRPIKPDGREDADVIVKLDRGRAIQYEKLRYDSYVKATLPPITARITDPTVVLDDPDIGGLKYTFVGQQDNDHTHDLYHHVQQNGPAGLGQLIKSKVYEIFGGGWWKQRQPYGFTLWQEYEHVLPPALVLELESDQNRTADYILRPRGGWSHNMVLKRGDVVALESFTIYRAYPERKTIKLVASTGPAAEDRANKVTVVGATSTLDIQGDRINQLVGRVTHTRQDILIEHTRAIFPYLNLDQQLIRPVSDGPAVPNPTKLYDQLLRMPLRGTLSTIHGDLHLGNILIDPDERVWLIDFAWTRDGHTLFDWAVLEVSLLTSVLSPCIGDDLARALPLLVALNNQAPPPQVDDATLSQAMVALEAVREVVHRCLASQNDWYEYFAGFSLCALRAVTWDTVSPEAKRLVFLASALAMAETLETLNNDQGHEITQGFGESGVLDTRDGTSELGK